VVQRGKVVQRARSFGIWTKSFLHVVLYHSMCQCISKKGKSRSFIFFERTLCVDSFIHLKKNKILKNCSGPITCKFNISSIWRGVGFICAYINRSDSMLSSYFDLTNDALTIRKEADNSPQQPLHWRKVWIVDKDYVVDGDVIDVSKLIGRVWRWCK
jgi:hypothetical protein